MLTLLYLFVVALQSTSTSAFVISPVSRFSTRQRMAPSSFGYKDGSKVPILPTFRQPEVTTIESLDDFLAFLSQDERLCVVK